LNRATAPFTPLAQFRGNDPEEEGKGKGKGGYTMKGKGRKNAPRVQWRETPLASF